MRRRSLLAGVGLSIGAAVGAYETQPPVRSAVDEFLAGPDPDDAAQLIRERINDERAAAGVAELPREETLATVARQHSTDMAERDFYDHTNPDGLGPSDRAGCRASETIQRGQLGEMESLDGDETYQTYQVEELAAFVVDGWVDSDAHYAILAGTRWQAIGVGVHVANEEFFATALYC